MKKPSPIDLLHKPFGSELKKVTLSLYQSLLRSTNQFTSEKHQWFLRFMIRERFRFHCHNLSKRSILGLLKEGDMALYQINNALDGNTKVIDYIEELSTGKKGPLAHIIKKLKNTPNLLKRTLEATDIRSQKSRQRNPTDRIKLPTYLHSIVKLNQDHYPIPTSQRKINELIQLIEKEKKEQRQRKLTKQHEKLKHYKYFDSRKAIQASSGYYFVRIKGIPLPTHVAVRMKKRVKDNQDQIDLFQKMLEDKKYIMDERLFLDQLKIKHDLRKYLEPINQVMAECSRKNKLKNKEDYPTNDPIG
ncbi:unnamed protein product [Cunninghamella blakesleeana]